ncbi:MAG: aminoacyl-histidine dipeptidase [Dorea sp.]|nr:aminoacyl-histidine dipeptidase [Dorea sp.]
MSVVAGLEPQKVLKFFEELCSMPHGSYNNQQISDYLVEFAKARNLKYRQDQALNVVIWKDGTKGYENSPAVILQGHMDMVAVQTDDCKKDMMTDGLDLMVEGEYLTAEGTSLGGDDCIAVAMALAVLDAEDLSHPPIEAIFTTDEEVGMLGAVAMECSDIKGRLMLNLDSEDEGVFTVSCAGGATAKVVLPVEKELVKATPVQIKISGLKGGHSGMEIDKERINANTLLGRLLSAVECEEVGIVSVHGGEKDNAIANKAEALLAVAGDEAEHVMDTVAEVTKKVQAEYATVDPDLCVETCICGEEQELSAFTAVDTARVITALMTLPNGVMRMNPDMEHMVQTSLNLGVLRTTENQVTMSYGVRSSVESEKEYLIDRIRVLAELLDGWVDIMGDYPGWEFMPKSELRDVCVEQFVKNYGYEPKIIGVHAGLECGVFASKLPGLQCISMGPQMKDIHTPMEVLSIPSTERTWKLVKDILANLK